MQAEQIFPGTASLTAGTLCVSCEAEKHCFLPEADKELAHPVSLKGSPVSGAKKT